MTIAASSSGSALGGSSAAVTGLSVTLGQLITVVSVIAYTSSQTPAAGDLAYDAGSATIGTPTLDKVLTIDTGNAPYFLALAYHSVLVTASGSLSIRITPTGSSAGITAHLSVWDGSWDSTRVEDAPTIASSATDNQTTFTSASATSAGASLFLAGLSVLQTVNNTITKDAAYTLLTSYQDGTTQICGGASYRLVGSGTTDDSAWTAVAASNYGWLSGLVVYKEVSGSSTALVGSASTAAQGAIAPNRSISLIGQGATAAAGNLSSNGDVSVSLSGQSVTASRGSISPARSRDLTGQSGTSGQGYIGSNGYPITIVGTPNPTSADRITAVADIVSGDFIQASGGGSAGASPIPVGLVIATDATWYFTVGNTPAAFDVRVLDSTGTWGAWATQSVGVTAALAGQGTTASAGSIGNTHARATTGQAATTALGALGSSRSIQPAGQAITAYGGVITASAGGNVTAGLSGQVATAVQGALSSTLSKALAGLSMTGSAGALTPAISIIVAGSAVTASPGVLIRSLSASLTGLSAAVSRGTLSATGGATTAIFGQGSSVATGAVTASLNLALAGQVAAAAQGSMGVGKGTALSGQSATAAQGVAALARALNLVGAALASAQGNPVVNSGGNITAVLSGASVTSVQGSMALAHALDLLGIPATLSMGSVAVNSGGNLTLSLTGLGTALAQAAVSPRLGVPVIGLRLTPSAGFMNGGLPPAPTPSGPPNPLPAGGYASPNTPTVMLTDDGATLRVGSAGCKIGQFAWADDAGIVGNQVSLRLGFAVLQEQYWYSGYWAAVTLVLREGAPITLLTTGDVRTRFAAGALRGARVYADVTTGEAVAESLPNTVETPWHVVTSAKPGQLAIISTRSIIGR